MIIKTDVDGLPIARHEYALILAGGEYDALYRLANLVGYSAGVSSADVRFGHNLMRCLHGAEIPVSSTDTLYGGKSGA